MFTDIENAYEHVKLSSELYDLLNQVKLGFFFNPIR